ncbi:GNAT family N-acetyltransferase [Chelatococcus sp. SYSU_G07232]|uniref:GNAT family N-acetyltransferase n=1 Tax=Chelatococcus albus TaxID=3047466 RepID=A0ABT7AKR4_9HYPH|nr:GNAT family N-acetyltransferase [Chelatococcus sp. SYSU_G07232]MDJ1159700.1 GNAT family N-acetyltransferase [Chelatococcus sp. SYSU_G07232]
MDALTCRFATAADATAVAGLIDALDRYYLGEARAPGYARTLAMVETVFATREGTHFLLASLGDRPVGVACLAVLRPGHRLQGVVFVKDLFVLEALRGRGIGAAMLRAIAAFARDSGIGRIDLTTDMANAGARRLYERLGATRMEKVFYRFSLAGDALSTEHAEHDVEAAG